VPRSSVSLILGFNAMLSVSLVSRLLLEICMIICLDVNRHLVSGHEISRLQHGLQLIMARYTRIINCRPCCNLCIADSGKSSNVLRTLVDRELIRVLRSTPHKDQLSLHHGERAANK